MKRYQNPVIFEHLAMSYALGTLPGKARLRFEKLMAKHLYLRAVTTAYQQQFAPLATLLPSEVPPPRVWNAIERELNFSKIAPASNWLAVLKHYLPWSVAALASLSSIVMAVLLFAPSSQPAAYMAMMKSPVQTDKMIVAIVSHKAMQVSFTMPDGTLPVEKNMIPTFWCIHKDKNIPMMRIGTLAQRADYTRSISHKVWGELANIGEFVISLEPMDAQQSKKPMGKVLFSGELATL